jgi:uncharacterized protein
MDQTTITILVCIVAIILFISFGIFITNTAPKDFFEIYTEYRDEEIDKYYSVKDFVNRLHKDDILSPVTVAQANKTLEDSFSCATNTVYLSYETYNGSSVADFAVMAHEYGHAQQNLSGSTLYKNTLFMRSFCRILGVSYIFFILIGVILFFALENLPFIGIIVASIGVLLMLCIVVCSLLVTLVEFDASKRAIKLLKEYDVLNKQELKMAKHLLNKAGNTYLANFFSTILAWLPLCPKPKLI